MVQPDGPFRPDRGLTIGQYICLSVRKSVLSIYKQSVYLKFGADIVLIYVTVDDISVMSVTARTVGLPRRMEISVSVQRQIRDYFLMVLYISERTDLTIGQSESNIQPKDDH